MRPRRRHPRLAHLLAVLVDRSGRRIDHQHRRHRHPGPQRVAGHAVISHRSDRAATGPTFDGLTRLSRSLNSRDDTLRQLLKRAGEVTGVLAQRSEQLNTLILNANDLIGVLDDGGRRSSTLLANTSALSRQLSGTGRRQRKATRARAGKAQLGDRDAGEEPRQHRQSAARAGEIPNHPGRNRRQRLLLQRVRSQPASPQQFLQPFLDYSFGFRRGVDAGQPPDNAGPRAEFPFPYNGIPGG